MAAARKIAATTVTKAKPPKPALKVATPEAELEAPSRDFEAEQRQRDAAVGRMKEAHERWNKASILAERAADEASAARRDLNEKHAAVVDRIATPEQRELQRERSSKAAQAARIHEATVLVLADGAEALLALRRFKAALGAVVFLGDDADDQYLQGFLNRADTDVYNATDAVEKLCIAFVASLHLGRSIQKTYHEFHGGTGDVAPYQDMTTYIEGSHDFRERNLAIRVHPYRDDDGQPDWNDPTAAVMDLRDAHQISISGFRR